MCSEDSPEPGDPPRDAVARIKYMYISAIMRRLVLDRNLLGFKLTCIIYNSSIITLCGQTKHLGTNVRISSLRTTVLEFSRTCLRDLSKLTKIICYSALYFKTNAQQLQYTGMSAT